MSAQDTTLADFFESDFSYTPLNFWLSDVPESIVNRELRMWDMAPSWLGAQPSEVSDDVEFHRYQFDRLYFYPIAIGYGDDRDSELGVFEFRTYVNWVGDPPNALKDRIRETDNPRLATLFDSGPYEGWTTGFNLVYHTSNVEDNRVAASDVNNLGIPQFEVLCMDEDGSRVGHAGGFFDPFALIERAPQQEVWNVTKNPARESYEIRPQSRARQRLMGRRKQVYLNGHYIGNTVPTRGTVWLKMEYGTLDGTYKDSRTGQQMWSRQKLIEAGMHPQGIRAGGRVYKVEEDSDRIFLVSNQPDEFQPTAAEEVDPSRAREMTLAETTTFNVRHDSGPKLGKYTPPVTRDIEYESDTAHFGTRPGP